MSITKFQLDSKFSAADIVDRMRVNTNSPRQSLARISQLFRGLASGFRASTTSVTTGAVQAAQTLTFTDQPTAEDTFVLGGVTFTAKTSGASGEEEWNLTSGGTAQADANGNAASVVALVNAHSLLGTFLTAVAVLGVVTFTADDGGVVGNQVPLTESLDNATVGGATLEGGVEGTLVTLNNQ